MKVIGQNPDGYPIPGVPEPGDPIRILFIDLQHPNGQFWATAYLVRLDRSGLWWAPNEDRSGAVWTSWTRIESVEGPEADA